MRFWGGLADSGEIGTHVYIPDAHFLFPRFFSGSVNRRKKKTQSHSFLNKRRKEKRKKKLVEDLQLD